jgi:hypothetical protein
MAISILHGGRCETAFLCDSFTPAERNVLEDVKGHGKIPRETIPHCTVQYKITPSPSRPVVKYRCLKPWCFDQLMTLDIDI